jgi:hypothetical protein
MINTKFQREIYDDYDIVDAEDYFAALDEIDRLTLLCHQAIRDGCETDTDIKKMLRPHLGDWVDGDKYAVPNAACCVEEFLKRLHP